MLSLRVILRRGMRSHQDLRVLLGNIRIRCLEDHHFLDAGSSGMTKYKEAYLITLWPISFNKLLMPCNWAVSTR